MAFLVHPLPPINVYVRKEYLYDLEKGHGELTPGVWISVKSTMGKALYFETLLTDYGALYDKLPISASNLYSKNLLNFVINLYDKKNNKININLEDEIIKKTLVK